MSGEDVHRIPTSLSVLLCRDCCCGTERKHPDFSHDLQESDLRAAVADIGGKVHRVKCLDACSHSNVVVLRTRQHGKLWFGGLADEVSHAALMAFVRDGARGKIPSGLLALQFIPSAASVDVESRCNLKAIPVR